MKGGGLARHLDGRVLQALGAQVLDDLVLRHQLDGRRGCVAAFRVEGLGVGVEGVGFRIEGAGFRVKGVGCSFWGFLRGIGRSSKF